MQLLTQLIVVLLQLSVLCGVVITILLAITGAVLLNTDSLKVKCGLWMVTMWWLVVGIGSLVFAGVFYVALQFG